MMILLLRRRRRRRHILLLWPPHCYSNRKNTPSFETIVNDTTSASFTIATIAIATTQGRRSPWYRGSVPVWFPTSNNSSASRRILQRNIELRCCWKLSSPKNKKKKTKNNASPRKPTNHRQRNALARRKQTRTREKRTKRRRPTIRKITCLLPWIRRRQRPKHCKMSYKYNSTRRPSLQTTKERDGYLIERRPPLPLRQVKMIFGRVVVRDPFLLSSSTLSMNKVFRPRMTMKRMGVIVLHPRPMPRSFLPCHPILERTMILR